MPRDAKIGIFAYELRSTHSISVTFLWHDCKLVGADKTYKISISHINQFLNICIMQICPVFAGPVTFSFGKWINSQVQNDV